MNDFYFSKKMFDNQIKFATSEIYEVIKHEDSMFVCEVFINNEWKIFTEQIGTGNTPVTKNQKDLVFLGTQDKSQTRYTPISKWVNQKRELLLKNDESTTTQFLISAYIKAYLNQ